MTSLKPGTGACRSWFCSLVYHCLLGDFRQVIFLSLAYSATEIVLLISFANFSDLTNCKILLIPWAQEFMRTWIWVLPNQHYFLQWLLHSDSDVKSLRHSYLLLCVFSFDWPLPFLLFFSFPPPPFLFLFCFKASLSTWSFSRNIWHDDTGVWQVTSLETQRHEEKSKTLLISL